jgi:hypothetical protein
VPSNIDNAERWRKLAEEARAVADQMTDLDTKQIMLSIERAMSISRVMAKPERKIPIENSVDHAVAKQRGTSR